jgi:hypothetical protein
LNFGVNEAKLLVEMKFGLNMEKKTRNLKVVRSFCTKPKALLPLSGCWLERAGFKVGMRVDVIVREKCLVILPSGLDESEV